MTPVHPRSAGHGDVTEIVDLIRELAAYERSEHLVEATAYQVRELLFGGSDGVSSATHVGRPAAYCHVVDHPDPAPGRSLAGMALWFLNTSTWTGRHGVYLEDLYVRPECRGLGIGTTLLSTLASVCLRHGYRRLEWWVLDWNEPALEFYRSLGAVAMDEWTVHRVSGDALATLAALAPGATVGGADGASAGPVAGRESGADLPGLLDDPPPDSAEGSAPVNPADG